MAANTGAEPAAPAGRVPGALYDTFWGALALLAGPLALAGGRRWRDKTGRYAPPSARPRCWIHACSVGEVQVALRAMEALRRRRPDLAFTLSTVTPEGFAAAQAGVAGARDEAVFFPFDARRSMRRAYERLAPAFVILTEVELWPNHLREAAARRIPVFVINGRLTAGDEKNYRRGGAFLRRVFAVPELVCARGPEEAARFARLGAREVAVAGDLKFETLAPAQTAAARSGRLLLGASTHRGEEEILLRTLRDLRGDFAQLRLVLVPRHPRRAATLARLAVRRGFRAALSSRGAVDAEVTVVDEIGRLPDWYARATVCFVGKSLTARGGQNFLEAAAAGCPVVTGPHLENFAAAAGAFLDAGAMVQVADANALTRELARLLSDSEARERLRTTARELVERGRGAADRTAALVLERLGTRL